MHSGYFLLATLFLPLIVAAVLVAVPDELIAHHVNAIHAIFREQSRIEAIGMADELSKRLRGLADEYLIAVNKDRPEHLEVILSPGIAPAD